MATSYTKLFKLSITEELNNEYFKDLMTSWKLQDIKFKASAAENKKYCVASKKVARKQQKHPALLKRLFGTKIQKILFGSRWTLHFKNRRRRNLCENTQESVQNR